MADQDKLFYEFKDTPSVTLQDDMYSKMSVEERQRAWEKGLRPVNEAWQIVYPEEARRKYEFINKGRVFEQRYSGNKAPKSMWSKEDHAKEIRARQYRFAGGEESAPLPWRRKDHNSATKLMNTIQWFRDNPDEVEKGDFMDVYGGAMRRMPLTFGAGEIAEAVLKGKQIDRIYEGNAQPGDYYGVAKEIVYAEMQEEDPRAMKVVRGVSELPAYAVDIAVTGGLGGATRAAGRKGLAILAKRLGKEKFKKFMASAAVRGAVKAAPAVTEAGIYAGVTDVGGTAAQALPQRDIKYDETTETGFAATEKDSWMNSLPKAVINQMSEYLVEKVGGEALARGAGKIGAPIRKAMTPKPTSADVPENMKTYILNRIRQTWQRANPNLGPRAKQIGFNGMIAELGEERVTEIVQGANEAFFSAMPGYERDAAPQIDQRFGMTGDVVQEAGYQLGVTDETPEQASQRRDDMLTQGLTEVAGIGAMKGMAGGRAIPTPSIQELESGKMASVVLPLSEDMDYQAGVIKLIEEDQTSRKAFSQVQVPGTDQSLYDILPNGRERSEFLDTAMDYINTTRDMESNLLQQQQQQQPAPQPTPVQPEAQQPVPEQQQPIQQQQATDQLQPTDTVSPPAVPDVAEAEENVAYAKIRIEAAESELAGAEKRGENTAPYKKRVEDAYTTLGLYQQELQQAQQPDPQPVPVQPEAQQQAQQQQQESQAGWDKQWEQEDAAQPQPAAQLPPDTPEMQEAQRIKSNITRKDVMGLTKGRSVKEMENGFELNLINGRVLVLTEDTFDVSDQQLESLYSDYTATIEGFQNEFPTFEDYQADYREKEARGEWGAGFISGPTAEMKDNPATMDVLGVITINNSEYGRKNYDQLKTLTHELMHVAFNSGMFKGREMDALIDRFSKPENTARQHSEAFALNQEFWQEPGMMQRFTDWINRVLSKITRGKIKLNGEAVTRLLNDEGFWGREAQSIDTFQAREAGRLQGIDATSIQGMADTDYTRPTGEDYALQQQTRTGQLAQEQGTQAGEIRERGSLPRGSEQLSTQNRATIEKPALEGLPTNIKLKAYPDAKIGPSKIARTAAAVYAERSGIDYNPPSTYQKVDKQRAARIADWYESAEHIPNDPAVKKSYRAMMDETLAQWLVIKETGLQVDWITEDMDDPYAESPRLATEDIRRNNHFYVFPTDLGFGSDADFDPAQNPLFELTNETIAGKQARYNDIFRIVHDYFGHVKEGNGFRAFGEENAWRSHAAMYSPLARPAMTMETRGQNSWVNYGPHGDSNRTASGEATIYADQKINIPPAWINEEGATDPIIQGMPDQQFTGERGDGLAIPARPKVARIAYNQADANRIGFKRSHQEVINEVNTRRSGSAEERQAADEAAIDRWRDPNQMFDVFDHEHIIRLSTELAMTGDATDYAQAVELIELKRERVAEVARVLGYGRDPLSQSPTQRRKNATKDAVFEPDEKTKEKLKHLNKGAGAGPGLGAGKGPGPGQPKLVDPAKEKVAQKAWEKERVRLKKIEKFMTDLGYEFNDKGFGKLAQNLKDNLKVVQFALRTKKTKGRQAYDIFTEITYGFMLSGHQTQLVNAMSNTAWGATMMGEQYAAAAVNSILGNTQDITLADYKYARKVMKDMTPSKIRALTIAGKNAVTRFVSEKAVIEEQVGADEKAKYEIDPAIPGRTGKVFRATFGFGPMAAVDQFYKTLFTNLEVGVHAAHLARVEAEDHNKQAKDASEKLTEEDIADRAEELMLDKRSQAWVAALRQAEQKMFQDEGGAISQGVIRANEKIRKIPVVGPAFQHLFAPFVRTPVRILGNALVRVPVLGFPVYQKMYTNYRDGNHVLKGVTREAVSQLAVGLMVGLLWDLVDPDEEETTFTGAKGALGERSRTFRYQEGVAPPQAVRIAGRWWQYDRLDPFAFGLATVVDAIQALKSDKSLAGKVGDIGRSVGGSVQEKTFFRSVGDLAKAVESEDGGQRWIASVLTRFVPNLYTQAARGISPTVKDPRSETVVGEFKKRSMVAPGEDIHDAWGRKAKASGGITGVRSKTTDTFVGDRVFINWNRLNPNAKDPKYPTRPSPEYRVNGVDYRMPEKQYAEYAELAGTLAKDVIEKMISTEMARNPDDVTIKITEGALRTARAMIKEHMHTKGNLDIPMDRFKRDLQSKLYSSAIAPLRAKRPRRGSVTENYEKEVAKWQSDRDAALRYVEWYRQRPDRVRIRR